MMGIMTFCTCDKISGEGSMHETTCTTLSDALNEHDGESTRTVQIVLGTPKAPFTLSSSPSVTRDSTSMLSRIVSFCYARPSLARRK
jgi:hypothetical protein